VRERVFRSSRALEPHWSAQIEELPAGERHAADSWPHANGAPPEISRYAVWRREGVEPPPVTRK
jgi:hypothetical protein